MNTLGFNPDGVELGVGVVAGGGGKSEEGEREGKYQSIISQGNTVFNTHMPSASIWVEIRER